MGLGAWAKASANLLVSSLFEPPCAACRETLINPLDGSVCEVCWASIRRGAIDVRFDASHPIGRAAAVDVYEGRMKDIVHALKYDRRRSISPRLAGLMRDSGRQLLNDADCVVPVPLHPRREYRRGFNQAHDLAIHLGPPVMPLLRRAVFTRSQIDLPKHQRRLNVRDAFALNGTPAGVSMRIVVLVDDVCTTGATLESCATVLLRNGVKEVRALTAAYVRTS